MSFLKIGDRAAGAIKSGGTTRRAAKMVCLDLDHPDIEAFINWKAEEENKVKALIAAGYSPDFNGEAYATVSGQNSNNSIRVPHSFLKAVEENRRLEPPLENRWFRMQNTRCRKPVGRYLRSCMAVRGPWGSV